MKNYRKITVGTYYDSYAVYAYGDMIGDLDVLCTGTMDECFDYIQDQELEYLVTDPDDLEYLERRKAETL